MRNLQNNLCEYDKVRKYAQFAQVQQVSQVSQICAICATGCFYCYIIQIFTSFYRKMRNLRNLRILRRNIGSNRCPYAKTVAGIPFFNLIYLGTIWDLNKDRAQEGQILSLSKDLYLYFPHEGCKHFVIASQNLVCM